MKKKILSFVLAICLLIPCLFLVSACDSPEPSMTNAELAVAFKNVARSTWEHLDLTDPTIDAQTVLISSIPDNKQTVTGIKDTMQVQLNAGNVANILYLIGSIYDHEDFALVNNIAKFNATATVGGTQMTYTFNLKPFIDVKNNKVRLEYYILVDGSSPQYCIMEADYHFETTTLEWFRLCIVQNNNYDDISLAENSEHKYYNTTSSSSNFAVAVATKRAAFVAECEQISVSNANFNTEVQTYMDNVMKIMQEVMSY